MSSPPEHAIEAREERIIVPRPVVVIVVLVFTMLVAADILGQFIPGSDHAASPVIDGALIALIAAVITGARGPRPDEPRPPDKPPTLPDSGRHRIPPGEDP